MIGNLPDDHPFSAQLVSCDSPEAVSNVLRTQAQAFSKIRKGDEKLMAWLEPIVHILFTFSGTLGEARMARHPGCPWQVFPMYKLVANSGDVLIRKRRFAIANIRGLVTASPLSHFCEFHLHPKLYPHRSRIFLVGLLNSPTRNIRFLYG